MAVPTWIRWSSNRLELLAGRASRGKGLQVLRVADLDVLVDHRAADIGSLAACRPDGAYGRMIQSMSLPDAPSVLDVGANIGGFPVLLRLLGIQPRQVVCVELNPRTFARLRCNVEGNYSRCEVLNLGVTSDGRELCLRMGAGSTSDSVYRPGGHEASHVRVAGATLDQVADRIEGRIDLCKIDIEHAEKEVLRQGVPSITALARIENLLIEIHPAEHLNEIVACLEANGLTWRAHERDLARPALGVNWFARAT